MPENKSPVAAVDWSSKTFDIAAGTEYDHAGGTMLDISGSGYLVGFASSSNSSDRYRVQIDGGTIYSFNDGGSQWGVSLFPLNFDSSLTVTTLDGPSEDQTATVVLD